MRSYVGADKLSVVGRRPRSDEYHPTVAATQTAAASGGVGAGGAINAGEMRISNHHSRPPQHYYNDYSVQVRCHGRTLWKMYVVCRRFLCVGLNIMRLLRLLLVSQHELSMSHGASFPG